MEEMKFVDLLVSGCYKALSNFDLFSTWTMLYFTAAIAYEQKRLGGVIPGCFLEADNLALRNIVEVSYTDLRQVLTDDLHSERAINEFTSRVRKRIGPYNIAGLLDPSARNMYRHTAAEM